MEPDPTPRPPDRTPVPVSYPNPGLRFALVFALWKNAADWHTRGQALRLALAHVRRRIFPPAP